MFFLLIYLFAYDVSYVHKKWCIAFFVLFMIDLEFNHLSTLKNPNNKIERITKKKCNHFDFDFYIFFFFKKFCANIGI